MQRFYLAPIHADVSTSQFAPAGSLRQAQDKRQIQRSGGGFGNPPRAEKNPEKCKKPILMGGAF